MDYVLCLPGPELSCLACCPPIRPAGYEHLADRAIWARELRENRAAFLAGRRPVRPVAGFSCPGLGFLDPAGRRAGCLYHPARNQGRDLRAATGYAEKCAREGCPQARAFANLAPGARADLLAPCAGMDPFQFSSRRHNPLRRLLEFGPVVAAAVARLAPRRPADLLALPFLDQTPPELGFLLGHLAAHPADPGLPARLAVLAERLARALAPPPPLEAGLPLGELCDEWEARLWRRLAGRRRATPGELARWRGRLPAPGG